ncbi:MAG TPA: type II secretion system protein GspM [Acidocella sp.]|jgi:general secretion pathway protein M|nr:type II secretion system protein GspM [Acidocella sp.]
MMHLPSALPDGRHGQALAVAITLLGVLLLWEVTAAPLLDWYEARQDELTQQRQLAAHMQALGREIPTLRNAVSAAGLQASDDQVLLSGNSDVIAGANLQTVLQGLAAQAGTSLNSAALQPAEQAGGLRRISMQVSVTASWPVLIALLQAIGTAQPRMIVNTLNITMSGTPNTDQLQQVLASFTVTGFRAASP